MEGGVTGDAGVVDQRVDPAKGLDALTDGARDAGVIGDIQFHYAQAFGRCKQGRVGPAHGGNDVPPLLQEMVGGGVAVTGRGAGDKDGLHRGSS
ncbi:hypothetical protein G6F56_014230 [Rhizopus delemar]|nr:hypothetical protein G6F56_014230 [Rhizopus delemar]